MRVGRSDSREDGGAGNLLRYGAIALGCCGAVGCWFGAGIALCGISGCGGGGYGVQHNPTATLVLLVGSGVSAAAAPAMVALYERSRKWALLALVLAFGAPLTGALLVGAGWDGLPTT